MLIQIGTTLYYAYRLLSALSRCQHMQAPNIFAYVVLAIIKDDIKIRYFGSQYSFNIDIVYRTIWVEFTDLSLQVALVG